MTKVILFMAVMTISASLFADDEENVKVEGKELCTASAEYISTVNYLKKKTEFKIRESDIFKVADEVSKGCTGASSRFINVTDLLIKVGLDTSSSIKEGMKFAATSNDLANSFIEIFKGTYQADKLDLDAGSALRVALKLTGNSNLDGKRVLDDYNHLLKFCVSAKKLELSPSYCANLSADIVQEGHKFKATLARPFTQLLEFMAFDEDGPQADLNSSMKASKEIIADGPMAAKNYITAFRFAVSKKGLGLDKKEATNFAKMMAKRSFRLERKD